MMQALIDQEREILYKVAQECGFCHERTLCQSQKIDELIYATMYATCKDRDQA